MKKAVELFIYLAYTVCFGVIVLSRKNPDVFAPAWMWAMFGINIVMAMRFFQVLSHVLGDEKVK